MGSRSRTRTGARCRERAELAQVGDQTEGTAVSTVRVGDGLSALGEQYQRV